MSIPAISSVLDLGPTLSPSSQGASPSGSESAGTIKNFGQFMKEAVTEVNNSQLHANDLTARYSAGEPMDIHTVMIASQEASVALNLAVEVRNKLVDAYQQIMNTQV